MIFACLWSVFPQFLFAQVLTTNYTSYYGGSGIDYVRDVAVDDQGNSYVVGATFSRDFPVTINAGKLPNSSGSDKDVDVTIVKFASDGSRQWARTFGGPEYDRAYAVEVIGSGSAAGVYVAGRGGPGLPTTANALQGRFAGDNASGSPDYTDENPAYGPQDGFVAKFSLSGQLVWATYLGDPGPSFIRDIDVDSQGNVFVAVAIAAYDFPYITSGAYSTSHRGSRKVEDAAVVKLSPDGARILWGTFIGGSGKDLSTPTIRVASDGGVVILGGTESTDFPTQNSSFQKTLKGSSDIGIAKLSSDGRQLLWSTYLGGSSEEGCETHNLAVSANGEIIAAAFTKSDDFPVTSGVIQQSRVGASEGFITVFSTTGQILRSTYLGGSGGASIEGVVVGSGGVIYVSGATNTTQNFFGKSTTLPPTNAFIVGLAPDLSNFSFSHLIGTNGFDGFRSLAVDSVGRLAAAGTCDGPNLATSVNASQPNSGGQLDGLISYFSPPVIKPKLSKPGEPIFQ